MNRGDSQEERRRRLGEAARWFARARAPGFARSDPRGLQPWLDASPDHRQAHARVVEVWDAAEAFRSEPELLLMREAALRRHPVSGQARRRSRWVVAAACVGAAAAAALTLFALVRSEPPVQLFQTGVGQTANIALTDGSRLTLDTDTVLRVRMGPSRRDIRLERGRAFFKVAKDRSRPFVVAAGARSVTATGTAFEVTAEPRRFEVLLVEGRVRVSQAAADGPGRQPATMTTDLEPGTRLSSVDGRGWILARATGADELAWMRGELLFDDKPLSAIVAEMNRYSRRKIVIGDPQVGRRTVYGAFMAGDVDQFVRALVDYKVAKVLSETESEVVLTAP